MKKRRIVLMITALAVMLTSFAGLSGRAEAGAPFVLSITPGNESVISDRWDGDAFLEFDRSVYFNSDRTKGAKLYKAYYDGTVMHKDLVGSVDGNTSFGLALGGTSPDDTRRLQIHFGGLGGSGFFGDPTNQYNNDYQFIYYLEIDQGLVVSRESGDPMPAMGYSDFRFTVRATPPQVTSFYPTGTGVNGTNLALVMSFDENIKTFDGIPAHTALLYKYDASATSWATAPHIECIVEVYMNQVRLIPESALEPNTLYGVMVSGIANARGNSANVFSDSMRAAFPGIDYPLAYMSDFRMDGVWWFRTASSFDNLTLVSTTPAANAIEVPLTTNIQLVFNKQVMAHDDGNDYYVYIKDYDTGAIAAQINVDDIYVLRSGGSSTTLTIDHTHNTFELQKNKRYYVEVDQLAFESLLTDEYSVGIYGRDWNFRTTTTHTVRFLDHNGGLIKEQTVDHETDATPPPDPLRDNYVFKGWSGSYLSVTENRDLSPIYNRLYALNYTPGTGGTILGTASQSVESGTDGAQVTASPNAHHHFVQWSDGLATAARIDRNVTADISVTALFEIDQHTLKYAAGPGGWLTGDADQLVDYGSNGTPVTAVANTGRHFVQWNDGVLDNPRTDIGVSANVDVTAQFAIDQFTLKYAAGAGGSLLGEPDQLVDYWNDGSQVTAKPDEGHHFVQWSDGVLTAARIERNVTGSIDVTAQFAINQYALTYTAGTGGTITGTLNQTVNWDTSGAEVTAEPAAGHHFTHWSDDPTNTNPKRTDTNVKANVDVTALFERNTYTLRYAAGPRGTLTGSALQSVLYQDSGAEVIAVPDTGCHFVKWSDGVLTAARIDIDVSGDIDVSAEFAVNRYALNYTAGTGGAIVGAANQTVEHGDSGTQVTAAPVGPFHFVKWSDGALSATRTDTNITGNLALTAEFTVDTYLVSFVDYDGSVLKTQVVGYGGAATAPAASRAGHTFIGWDQEYGFITANLTVTARYELNRYEVSFLGHDGALLKRQTVAHGGGASAPPAPSREGYTFTGWDRGFSNVTSDLAVKANYTLNSYKVIFADHDGSALSTQTVNFGEDAVPPKVGAREGYVFSAWDKDHKNIRADATITALYLPAALPVSGVSAQNGGTQVVVDARELRVTGASVAGGTATVNPDGTITLQFEGAIEPGDKVVTLTLEDGSTVTTLVAIPDKDIPLASAPPQANSLPWLWIVVAAVILCGAVLIVILIIQKNRAR